MKTKGQHFAYGNKSIARKLNAAHALSVIEVFGVRATLLTSQLPVNAWHAWLGDPTLADAILDRIVHKAHKITLKGESMRKQQAKP